MKDLVTVNQFGFHTNTVMIANMLKDGVNKKRDENTHTDILKTLKRSIFEKVDSIDLHSDSHTNANIYRCSITGAEFEESSYRWGRNRTARMYILNEEAFHLMITQITNYKNAMDVNLQFIKAFKLLKQNYQNKDNSILREIINKDRYGTLSEVNGLPREKQVRGYVRSKNGKELASEINKAIEATQRNLFNYDQLPNSSI